MNKYDILVDFIAELIGTAAAFFLVALMTFVMSMAFSFEWSWMLSLGVWAACVIARWVISAAAKE